MTARRGIALPAVLAVVVMLGLLSALALADATREWRVATLAEDAVHARAAALRALGEAPHPPDLAGLCLSAALVVQERPITVARGSATIAWRSLGAGVMRAEVEGRGIHGARHRVQALLVPDSAERAMGLSRCPAASRLVSVAGRWLDGHPDG